MHKTLAIFSAICCLSAAVSFFDDAYAYGIFCTAYACIGRLVDRLLNPGH